VSSSRQSGFIIRNRLSGLFLLGERADPLLFTQLSVSEKRQKNWAHSTSEQRDKLVHYILRSRSGCIFRLRKRQNLHRDPRLGILDGFQYFSYQKMSILIHP